MLTENKGEYKMSNRTPIGFSFKDEMMSYSRYTLEYLGIEYETDGEGFQSEIHYSVPQYYKDIDLFEKVRRDNHLFDIYIDALAETKSALRKAQAVRNDIPVTVKRLFCLELDMEKDVNFHKIIQDYIGKVVALDDTERSLPQYREWNDGDELTVYDFASILVHKKKAHSQDTYTYTVRKGEVWTEYKGFMKVKEYIEKLDAINKSIKEDK